MDELTIPLFPLATVIFPDGLLRLKIFEQRYLDMTKRCIADQSGFGIVSADATAGGFASVGTLLAIKEWDMPHTGIFELSTFGATRFSVQKHWVEKDGLVMATVAHIPDETDMTLPAEHAQLADIVEGLAKQFGSDRFPEPMRLDSASWVGARLTEVMPIPLRIKQQLLEVSDPLLRLKAISKFLVQQKITQ